MTTPPATDRLAELAASLAAVRHRIARACAEVGRDPSAVDLLVVTKTFPVSDVAALTDLGITDFAENRDSEAARKVADLAVLRPGVSPRWQMVGRLQRNKARSVARWAHQVQSVDSPRLVDALAVAASAGIATGERAGPLNVLIQVSIDGDPARGGCLIAESLGLADRVAEADSLRLRGVMAVAPLGMPPADAFERLAEVAARLRERHPVATVLSAGMSGDLESAIRYGSTCVRVGTAVLGGRPLASP